MIFLSKLLYPKYVWYIQILSKSSDQHRSYIIIFYFCVVFYSLSISFNLHHLQYNMLLSDGKCSDITTPWKFQCPISCEYIPTKLACNTSCIDGTGTCFRGIHGAGEYHQIKFIHTIIEFYLVCKCLFFTQVLLQLLLQVFILYSSFITSVIASVCI